MKYGTPVWERRSIDGPGIWVSCEACSFGLFHRVSKPPLGYIGVKGKEKKTAGELYDLFESVR